MSAEPFSGDGKSERALLKRAVLQLGWKLSGRDTAEVRIEREFAVGPRTVVVRGRVAVPLPAELTAQAGEQAAAAVAEPAMAAFAIVLERLAGSILSAPDDVAKRHVFENGSFFVALENARRGLVRDYQELENKRIDERVEADLGLRFYVEGFTHEARTFEYYAGPTNSGKTYAAIEVLRASASGTYLAPLRLLALEVHERLNELGVRSSLVTGEERVLLAGAEHVSSTVEMVDLSRSFDVAVVDEAQMLQDEQRGWAWTLAIAAVRAKRVILCGSEDGLHSAQALAGRLNVRIDVRRFERKNPLRVIDAVPLVSLRRGDAVVAFSRNEVVELQGAIGRAGLTTAAIYGSLSPIVRRREAQRFRSGEAAVLVATDAIGLGLNLPIRRLIFATLEKYDGEKTRLLKPAEIRQIAGRAGRFGIHEEGQVSAVDAKWTRLLRNSIERFDPPETDPPIWISPTDEHLRRLSKIIGTTLISRLLQFFATRVLRDEDSGVKIANLADPIEVALALESSPGFVRLPLPVRASYSRAPVNLRGNGLAILTRWGEQHAAEGTVSGDELTSGVLARDRLLLYEDRSRLATLYLWLAQRFPGVYTNVEAVMNVREQTDEDIHDALMQHGTRRKAQPKKTFRRNPPAFNPRRIKR